VDIDIINCRLYILHSSDPRIGGMVGQYVSSLVNFKKAYDSGEKYYAAFSLNLVYLWN